MVFARRVVGNVCIADVFDVSDHAVEDFGDFNVGVVIGWNNLATWAVLPLVIGDLSYMLRQLVDGKRRARVDRLPLHGPTGGQHVRWPLPVVVGRACVELQVVNLIFAALRQRVNRHVEASASGGQDTGVSLLVATVGHSTGCGDACVICHYFLPFWVILRNSNLHWNSVCLTTDIPLEQTKFVNAAA